MALARGGKCRRCRSHAASSNVTSVWPSDTCSPSAARTSSTTPATEALTGCSIFMASTSMRVWPASTVSPGLTITRPTFPGMGETAAPASAAEEASPTSRGGMRMTKRVPPHTASMAGPWPEPSVAAAPAAKRTAPGRPASTKTVSSAPAAAAPCGPMGEPSSSTTVAAMRSPPTTRSTSTVEQPPLRASVAVVGGPLPATLREGVARPAAPDLSAAATASRSERAAELEAECADRTAPSSTGAAASTKMVTESASQPRAEAPSQERVTASADAEAPSEWASGRAEGSAMATLTSMGCGARPSEPSTSASMVKRQEGRPRDMGRRPLAEAQGERASPRPEPEAPPRTSAPEAAAAWRRARRTRAAAAMATALGWGRAAGPTGRHSLSERPRKPTSMPPRRKAGWPAVATRKGMLFGSPTTR
mmetsp:Transcript_10096/g.39335  ORF Transcript_10096/g.39335 Transcript_10096/m.39335 type:complete len:421 (+) Transcript_10096:100-1362(+)